MSAAATDQEVPPPVSFDVFRAYRRVQAEGLTNMMDARRVISLSNYVITSVDQVQACMRHYEAFCKAYFPDTETVLANAAATNTPPTTATATITEVSLTDALNARRVAELSIATLCGPYGTDRIGAVPAPTPAPSPSRPPIPQQQRRRLRRNLTTVGVRKAQMPPVRKGAIKRLLADEERVVAAAAAVKVE